MNSTAQLLIALAAARIDLRTLNQHTDKEFGNLGNKLVEASGKAKMIVEQSSAAAAALADEEFCQNLAALSGIPALVEALPRSHVMAETRLGEMLAHLETCRRLVNGFPHVVIGLKVLAQQMRTEAAWIHEAEVDFAAVAEDVGRLAVNIDERSQGIGDSADSLIDLIHRAQRQLLALSHDQDAELSSLLIQSRESIDMLANAGADSARAAEAISDHYQGVYTGVSEVVRSIQFQDIARQQLEHVQEGLDEMAKLLEAASRRWLFRDGTMLAQAGQLGAVQIAQLEGSRQMLVSAVTGIIERLGEIAEAIHKISLAPVALAQSAEGQDPAFLNSAAKHLNDILDVLGRYHRSSAEVSAVMAQVAQRVIATKAFADQIESIGFRLRLASLNAQIKAAHLGHQGAALGMLAGRVQEVTDDTTGQTAEVAEQLRLLSAELVVPTETSEPSPSVVPAASVDDLASEVGRVLQVLSHHGRSFREKLTSATSLCASVEVELASLAASIQSHSVAEEILGRISGQMAEPIEALRRRYRMSAVNLQHLDEHAARYTMSSERDVHKAFHGEPGTAPEPLLAGAHEIHSSDDKENLGSNVDLF